MQQQLRRLRADRNSQSELRSPYANCMTSFGTVAVGGNYNDGATCKTDGMISVDGSTWR